MRIDFRKGCLWYKSAPKIIACDGTKIGIGFKSTFVTPTEIAEKRAPANASSPQRLYRCFLHSENKSDFEQCKVYATARKVLHNISEAALNSNLPQVSPETINNLRMLLPTDSVDAYNGMVDEANSETKQMRAYASGFRLLLFDTSVDAITPLSFCQTTMKFLKTCDQCQCTKSSFTAYVERISFFSSEFANLIIVTSDGITPVNAVLKLLRHCTKLVIDCHSSDNPPEASFIMEGTCNHQS